MHRLHTPVHSLPMLQQAKQSFHHANPLNPDHQQAVRMTMNRSDMLPLEQSLPGHTIGIPSVQVTVTGPAVSHVNHTTIQSQIPFNSCPAAAGSGSLQQSLGFARFSSPHFPQPETLVCSDADPPVVACLDALQCESTLPLRATVSP